MRLDRRFAVVTLLACALLGTTSRLQDATGVLNDVDKALGIATPKTLDGVSFY